jgi:sporulation protein YqfC
MDRGKRDGGVLDSVAELFDLPADVVARLPRMEMIGSRQLYLERHQGILSYQSESVDINTPAGILRVSGRELVLLAMTAEEVRIGGVIERVEWVR